MTTLRARTQAAALTVVLAAVTACSNSPAHPTSARPPSPRSAAQTVTLTASGGTANSGPWMVAVPTATAGAALTVIPDPTLTTPPPTAVTLGAHPLQISLSGSALPASGATLTMTRTSPVPDGQTAALGFYDQGNGAWRSVPSTLSPDRLSITATVHHFSTWDDLYYDVGKLATQRTEPATCVGKVPSWVRASSFLEDRNAPFRWCIGADPAHPDVAVLKVRNNRAYGFALRPAVAPAFAYSSLASELGLEDLLTAGLRGTLNAPAAIVGALKGVVFLAPDTEADFGFTQAQVRAAGTGPILVAERDPMWSVAGALYAVMSKGAGSKTAGTFLLALISTIQCGQDVTHANSPALAVVELAKCSVKEPDLVKNIVIDLGVRYTSQSPKVIAKAAVAARTVMLEIGAFFGGAQIGEFLSDLRLDGAAFEASIFPTIPKRLKLPEVYYGEWGVHGGGLTVSRDGTAFGWGHDGFTASGQFIYGMDEYRIVASTEGKDGIVTLTKSYYGVFTGDARDRDHVQRQPDPYPQYPSTTHIGDRYESICCALDCSRPHRYPGISAKTDRPATRTCAVRASPGRTKISAAPEPVPASGSGVACMEVFPTIAVTRPRDDDRRNIRSRVELRPSAGLSAAESS
jgi:hypothetical protein